MRRAPKRKAKKAVPLPNMVPHLVEVVGRHSQHIKELQAAVDEWESRISTVESAVDEAAERAQSPMRSARLGHHASVEMLPSAESRFSVSDDEDGHVLLSTSAIENLARFAGVPMVLERRIKHLRASMLAIHGIAHKKDSPVPLVGILEVAERAIHLMSHKSGRHCRTCHNERRRSLRVERTNH